MTMKGADAVLKALEQEGVEVVFGIPGGASMPIYDPLVDRSPIRHVLCRHEQGAGHAAEGYAWATGTGRRVHGDERPGRDEPRDAARRREDGLGADRRDHGPGAHAGRRQRRVPGGGHHRASRCRSRKHNFLVKDPAEIVETVREAFHIASTGRPGPVLIDLPKDVLLADVDVRVARARRSSPATSPTTKGNQRQVSRP